MTSVTPDDLRAVGYVVDDTTTPGAWAVSGLGRTWVFPADDAVTARRVYELALTADNLDLRTQAEGKLADLDAALSSWDTLNTAQFRATMKTCVQVVVRLARMTIRRYSE